MINTRTYIRLLKHLGVALIFAPEPFTTPFGVAAILAARHLSKRHDISVNNRLRETLQYYLAHAGHFGEWAGGASRASVPVKRCGFCAEQPILGQITGSRSLGAESSIRQGRRDIQRGTANHTGHTGSLSRPYNVGQPKAIPHATNATQRRQHYGSAVSSTAVLSALRNNNYYYEVLSQKNVIGGY